MIRARPWEMAPGAAQPHLSLFSRSTVSIRVGSLLVFTLVLARTRATVPRGNDNSQLTSLTSLTRHPREHRCRAALKTSGQ